LTSDGIVLIYNGGDGKFVYRAGIAIFDRKDPSKLLWRSSVAIFSQTSMWV
jgi:predicted GH43/DUF377 family glycosyl hydrolase